MAAKEISVKKYVVRLSGEERERLETLIRKGKSPARRVLKARILLKARCLGSWQRVERQPDHRSSGNQPHRRQHWVIPPKANSAFVAAMEDVLAVYTRPRDGDCPLVRLDETSKQLIAETRVQISMKAGRPARFDYEYERNGTANFFREPRTILAFGSGCSARAEVSPRSGTVLTPGRRPRGPLHDATRSPPVSALKRVQLPSARAEPAGGCCSRGSSCRS